MEFFELQQDHTHAQQQLKNKQTRQLKEHKDRMTALKEIQTEERGNLRNTHEQALKSKTGEPRKLLQKTQLEEMNNLKQQHATDLAKAEENIKLSQTTFDESMKKLLEDQAEESKIMKLKHEDLLMRGEYEHEKQWSYKLINNIETKNHIYYHVLNQSRVKTTK